MNPYQLSLAKESSFKSSKWCSESAKTSLSQKGGCNNPIKLQLSLIRKTLMLSKRYESFEVDVEVSYICPLVLTGPPAATLA